MKKTAIQTTMEVVEHKLAKYTRDFELIKDAVSDACYYLLKTHDSDKAKLETYFSKYLEHLAKRNLIAELKRQTRNVDLEGDFDKSYLADQHAWNFAQKQMDIEAIQEIIAEGDFPLVQFILTNSFKSMREAAEYLNMPIATFSRKFNAEITIIRENLEY